MDAKSNPRNTIEKTIHQVLLNSGRAAKPLQDEDSLFEKIGLDSLDLCKLSSR